MEVGRRLPIGAEPSIDGTTSFRVWAPKRRRVAVVVEGGPTIELESHPGGYFAGRGHASAGARYRFRLDDEPTLYPDPASTWPGLWMPEFEYFDCQTIRGLPLLLARKSYMRLLETM